MPDPYLFEDMPQTDWENSPLGKNGKTGGEKKPIDDNLPENLDRAIKLHVPDFSDPERKLSCFNGSNSLFMLLLYHLEAAL
jgi:hypothetical protein